MRRAVRDHFTLMERCDEVCPGHLVKDYGRVEVFINVNDRTGEDDGILGWLVPWPEMSPDSVSLS